MLACTCGQTDGGVLKLVCKTKWLCLCSIHNILVISVLQYRRWNLKNVCLIIGFNGFKVSINVLCLILHRSISVALVATANYQQSEVSAAKNEYECTIVYTIMQYKAAHFKSSYKEMSLIVTESHPIPHRSFVWCCWLCEPGTCKTCGSSMNRKTTV